MRIAILFLIITVFSGKVFSSQIHACFEPKGNCAQQIINTISQAKRQVLVQVYSFTSIPIAQSLVAAKNRGIDIEILSDKSQLKSNGSVLPYLKNKNIFIKIDYLPAIAHNKIMIIDREIVITGSYNFTANAEKRNAENLLIIHDKTLAKNYFDYWRKRNSLSKK